MGKNALRALPLALFWGTLPAHGQSFPGLEQAVRQQLNEVFSTAALLSNTEALTLGFVNFDPNEFLPIDDPDFGDENSIELRNDLEVYTLPWSWSLTQLGEGELGLTARVSYIHSKQELSLFPLEDATVDINDDKIYTLFLQPTFSYPLGKRWQFQFGLGAHLMRYDNDFSFRNPITRQLQPEIDNQLTNITVDAWMLQPELRADYRFVRGRGYWHYRSALAYSWGRTFNEPGPIVQGDPEAWRWLNGVSIRRPFPAVMPAQDYRVTFNRIDIRGDTERPFDTNHYYEFSAEWLLNTKGKVPLLDDVGVGLLVNYGSALKGASLILVYNVD
ncbi:Solitary outer membrane autotransporter beta-barrel domain [Ferrimonas balearica]|uniref:Solitary outer membrane autotransporter beta-barrel domain n=1 Tax=Ferrimonas balearica TaxID=44012 RepID=UPI001C99AB9E|nr:Solitary outer membrane autotransporter beta-barrel domain [Ferrimonas balearica]MBY5921223.1 Solitary outer membrane autotransporter beta-barrel domain [Ferrimonas balearica]MBY5996092.1 Solitary outer membrane autotransporter beta-barrel domain [Ferrimonas balearica]